MSELTPGSKYLDSSWTEWKLLYKVDEEDWECEFIEHHDGYIPNTPKFKLIPESVILNKHKTLSKKIEQYAKLWKQHY